MTYLAGEELQRDGNRVCLTSRRCPSRRRGKLIEEFDRDPGCKVFLSTDAGGVGLNLQVASAVINFEPPWNPARREQRIVVVSRPLLSSRSSDGWATTFVSPTCFYPAANR
jgi:hypothetical protein